MTVKKPQEGPREGLDRGDMPDTLTERIGVLARREVEARILIPVIDALGRAFGRDKVARIVGEAIISVAREQGVALAKSMGGNSSDHFLESLRYWTQNGALEIQVLKHDDKDLHFNVTRCRYAEMYMALGAPELGAMMSCNRDFALIEGFNPETVLTRTRTIMGGNPLCDFRYTFVTHAPAGGPAATGEGEGGDNR